MQSRSLESSSPFSKCLNVVCFENSLARPFAIWWAKMCSMDSEVASSSVSLIDYFDGSVEVGYPEQSASSSACQHFDAYFHCFPSMTSYPLSATSCAYRGFVKGMFVCRS